MVSYLAWPRRVEGSAIDRDQLEQAVNRVRGKSNGSIWLYGLAPSSNLKNWIIVERGLLFIPAE